MTEEEWEEGEGHEEYVAPPPYVPTADEINEGNARQAYRVMAQFISELTAKHMTEMGTPQRQNWLLNSGMQSRNDAQVWRSLDGSSHVSHGRYSCQLTITCTRQEFLERFADREKLHGFEHLGITGQWILKDASCVVSYSDMQIMSVNFSKIL